ncbi:MAG TPA: PEGA domain-containing protein [Methanoregulaceae archaeon]|nr:PEGA domain-containing protein [Methanoregulaceae archaeon]
MMEYGDPERKKFAAMRPFSFEKCVLLVLCAVAILLILSAPVFAATTELHIVKYASDRTTVLAEKTISYQEMEDTLPITGDGTTHYYLQGPVFLDDPDPATEEELRWNPEEDTNVQTKDMGAVRGTDLKDLCSLVGGMSPGDALTVVASDGMTRDFAYKNIYTPPSRQGPVVVTWAKDGKYPDTGYDDGMRLAFFADDSVNPWGIHALGNYDWHESANEEYWYYYRDGAEKYPTTTGLSVKYVAEIRIYSRRSATGGSSGLARGDGGEETAGDLPRSGYKGSELALYASGSLNGTIHFLSDPNSTPVPVNNRIRTYRIPVDLPMGSNLTLARMYLYISRSHDTRTNRGVVPSLRTSFNENIVSPDRVYLDADSDDAGNVSATYAYDVLPFLRGNGTVTVALQNLNFEQEVFFAEDAVILIACEEERGEPVRFWISEGCDVIHSEPENGIFPEDACTSADFTGTVNLSESGEADLVLVATNIDRKNSTEHLVKYNSGAWYNVLDSLPEAPVLHIPVTSRLNTTGNSVAVESAIRKDGADYLVTRNAVLVVQQNRTKDAAFDPNPTGNLAPVTGPEASPSNPATGNVTALPASCRLSLHSDPEGALIYLDGEYQGTTTPFTFEVINGEEYAIRLEREGFIPAERIINVSSDMTVREKLYSDVYSTRGRSSEIPAERNATANGGLYVHSRPSPAAIAIDGTLMSRRTPAIFYGIEQGSHVVRLSLVYADPDLEDNAEIVFDPREVAVLPHCIVPVDVAANISPLRDVIIDSRSLRGEMFTVNGNIAQKTIPSRARVPLFDSYATVLYDQSYVSYRFAAELNGDSYIILEPREHYTISLFVDSHPQGAEVFIDGFRTGFSTPFTFRNLSDGPHRIMVTKLGYIPEEKTIDLPFTSYPPADGSLQFILDEYESGFLRIKSDPPGASIVLDGLATGQVTPWLFPSVPTGDHSVTVSLGNITRSYSGVTVNALRCTNVSADLHEFSE